MSGNAHPGFRRGATQAAEIVKGSPFARTQFFSVEDGKNVHLRFLTDAEPDENGDGGWITVLQHQNIKTKPAPDGFKGNWPGHMSAVCRHDPAFAGIYDDCYICDFLVDGKSVKKPGGRVWALACVREEVIGDGSPELGGPENKGKKLGFRDVTRDVTIPAREAKDGQPALPEQTVTEKAILVVNMGYKNFFSLLNAYYSRNGTILDRDFWIQRKGNDLDTEYQIVGEDPIIIDGEVMDLREPKFMERYKTDLVLEEVLAARADDEFYARFFDPRFSADDGKVVSTGAAPEPKPDSEPDEDTLAAIANRVRGYKKEEGETPADAPAAEAPAEKEEGSQPAAVGGGMVNFDS